MTGLSMVMHPLLIAGGGALGAAVAKKHPVRGAIIGAVVVDAMGMLWASTYEPKTGALSDASSRSLHLSPQPGFQ